MVRCVIYYPQVALLVLDEIIMKTGSLSMLTSKSMWYTIILLARRCPFNSFVKHDMGMWFFGGGVGHKSTHVATDYFLGDCNHSDLGIHSQHNSIDNLMNWEDEASDSPIAEGSVLSGDDDYVYSDLLDKLEDIVSDDLEDDDSSKNDGTVEGGS